MEKFVDHAHVSTTLFHVLPTVGIAAHESVVSECLATKAGGGGHLLRQFKSHLAGNGRLRDLTVFGRSSQSERAGAFINQTDMCVINKNKNIKNNNNNKSGPIKTSAVQQQMTGR